MASSLALILGGVRSGKSVFAEKLAREGDRPVLYLATGVATDGEMAERIRRHRERRPAHWTTLEEPLHVAERLESALAAPGAPEVVLIDSLDVWVGNLLLEHEDAPPDAAPDAYPGAPLDGLESGTLSGVDRMLKVCHESGAAFVLVSGEVGLSLVPPNPLGRRFQDLLGEVNQRVAAAAGRVYLVVAGIPVELKGTGG